MIGVVNYGVSNLGSMLNMMKKIGVTAEPISTPESIMKAEKIILPGVGAFDNGMKALEDMNLVEPLKKRVLKDGIPFLGVCLGMQMLGLWSEEGQRKGLGIIDGYCVRFSNNYDNSKIRIPHMGWSDIQVQKDNILLNNINEARFYFVHSYHFVCRNKDDILATATYGDAFAAAVQKDNVYGVQFHPEKSHQFGMKLLRNFINIK